MAIYEGLSRPAQLYRERQLAESVLASYSIDRPELTLLTFNFNTVYRVDTPAGRYVLRLQQPDTLDPVTIAAEIDWLDALRHQASLPVPEPIANEAGELLTIAPQAGVKPRACVLFRWMDGQIVGKAATVKRLYKIGESMAKIHRFTQSWTPPPGFSRPRWDWQRIFGSASSFANGRVEPYLTDEYRAVFKAAAAQVEVAMAAVGEEADAFGIIHNDMHLWNILTDKGEIKVFDFEISGWGHWLLDIAVTIEVVRRFDRAAALRHAFLEGYTSVRPLPPGFEQHEQSFILARLGEMIGWVTETDSPDMVQYAPGSIARLAERMNKMMNNE